MKPILSALNKIWNSTVIKFILLLIIFSLLLLDFYQVSIFPIGPIDVSAIGNLGDWITGLITAFAVLVSAETLRVSNIDRKRIESEKEIAFIKDITNVFSWPEYVYDSATHTIIGLSIVFSNKTSLPIYDWNVEFENSTLTLSQLDLGPILPERSSFLLTRQQNGEFLSRNKLPRIRIMFTINEGEFLRDFSGHLKLISDELKH